MLRGMGLSSEISCSTQNRALIIFFSILRTPQVSQCVATRRGRYPIFAAVNHSQVSRLWNLPYQSWTGLSNWMMMRCFATRAGHFPTFQMEMMTGFRLLSKTDLFPHWFLCCHMSPPLLLLQHFAQLATWSQVILTLRAHDNAMHMHFFIADGVSPQIWQLLTFRIFKNQETTSKRNTRWVVKH